ncbi:MAG: putative rane protein [Campylobacterota bacterium]|nr:putative rane protein [Campylobacterota bacterium]
MPQSHKLIYGIYILVWVTMAINPKYPEDWLIENILVFLFFPFIVWMDSRRRFSLTALVALLIFACLHSLGSHYTYAEMEHFDVITRFLGFERNHFDRLVHFLFGLLLFRIIFEMAAPSISSVKTALLFTLTLVISISTMYEMLEWLAAVILHPELGTAFLGTQGDEWDAQKDTLCALTGALINLTFYSGYKNLFSHKNIMQQQK